MEARSRRVGFGFPGYNGPALPRALRSSRGRGESARKAAAYGGRAGFFELLATVAGQLLQEDNNREEQETISLAGAKHQRAECRDSQGKETESPGSLNLKRNLSEPTVVAASCLNSLRAGIKAEEVKKRSGLEKKQDATADSSQTVVNKEYTDCPSPDGHSVSSYGADIVVAAGSDCITVSTPEQKTPECSNQMAQSVSDNDENQMIKPDSESSLSSDVKHAPDSPETHIVTREAVGRLQIPKSEELRDCVHSSDQKEEKFGSRDSGLLCDMELDLPKASLIEESINFEGHDPMSSTGSEVTKPEFSSGEITHLNSSLVSEKDDALPRDMVRGLKESSDDEVLRTRDDVKPCRCADPCGKDDEGESGVEVDEKSDTETRKPLDVTLGKLVPERGGVECRFLTEQVLSDKERSDDKDNNCSSKWNLPESVAQKLKDSYAKGMRARKVMLKRSRAPNARSKRKHSDVETASDSDEAQGKKAYYRGMSYTRQRTSRGLPAKRKRGDGAGPDTPELHETTSDVMELGLECPGGEPPAAAAKLRSAKAASVATSPTAKSSGKFPKKSNEPHVKLTIRSFTIPELYFDLPESATVASLKRAVMDAAMNLLGGGLRVRVLLQGKKVPDEGTTLAQVGISRSVKPDSLGFMLEPSLLPSSSTSTPEDPLLVLSRAAGQPSPRYQGYGAGGAQYVGEVGNKGPAKTRASKIAGEAVDGETHSAPVSDHNEAKRSAMTFQATQEENMKGYPTNKTKGVNDRMSPSGHSTRVAAVGALAAIRAQSDASRRPFKSESESSDPVSTSQTTENTVPGSGAIILHPGTNGAETAQGLALVPVRQKAHSMDVSKRRVRRPFSVSEVEALVHAVEKLGTGRWRDVKLRAFEQAKHRTYVDLKDKWKTLVHTARIAPHQRRGEPVPQELLERVTLAHTYWTAQAAKQQAELDY